MAVEWEQAWRRALYGADGFYRRDPGPAAHFRTAGHAGAHALAAAIDRLATRLGATAVVDVGAGRGELLDALAHSGSRRRLNAVDLVARPAALHPGVGWSTGLDALPDEALDGALVLAWELLDTVPCPVVEVDAEGVVRTVAVDEAGDETLGGPATAAELLWCERWWPVVEPGQRAEVGSTRDRLWADLVARAAAAGAVAALAVDYAHAREDRPVTGSLAGYRGGRRVPPVPDGSGDITAHVALDAVAAAGRAAGAVDTRLTDQRTALRELGLTGRSQVGESLDAAALQRISTEAELLDAGGLGGFGWLLQRIGSRT